MLDDFIKRGVRPHGNLLTLSRYYINFDKEFFNRICRASGWSVEISEDIPFLNDEIIFHTLGFEHLESMDYSDYEWANIIHDLNDTNVSKNMIGKYDFIIDAGTIEHVFNLRNVLENIYKMLKIGGTFFFHQPTFDGLNHGYYNFSPCLFHDYFKVNNYQINAIVPHSIKDDFVYLADPQINDICVKMPIIEGSHNMVFGSVTKTKKTSFDVMPYQVNFPVLWDKSAKETIDETFKRAKNNSIYLYGTGNFCKCLLRMLPEKYRTKIAGLLSKDADEIGLLLYGHRIYSLDDIKEKNSTILIATINKYQNIVYNRIKNLDKRYNVVRLD